ncbi:MAG: gamma-glutamylcyclotransferase family protein, partial [Actinomycetota bacterium]
MTLYAAYGSNLDPRQMLLRAPYSPHRGTGWLRGWRLTFGGEEIGWEGAVATLAEDAGHSVFVSIYDLTATDEVALDQWEGVTTDLYRKIRVRIETLDGSPLCYIYVLNSFEGGMPSARYL